jgi:hypothetical protein
LKIKRRLIVANGTPYLRAKGQNMTYAKTWSEEKGGKYIAKGLFTSKTHEIIC